MTQYCIVVADRESHALDVVRKALLLFTDFSSRTLWSVQQSPEQVQKLVTGKLTTTSALLILPVLTAGTDRNWCTKMLVTSLQHFQNQPVVLQSPVPLRPPALGLADDVTADRLLYTWVMTYLGWSSMYYSYATTCRQIIVPGLSTETTTLTQATRLADIFLSAKSSHPYIQDARFFGKCLAGLLQQLFQVLQFELDFSARSAV